MNQTKKFFLLFLSVAAFVMAKAQVDTSLSNVMPAPAAKKKNWSKLDLSTRANDHFMVQFGYDMWPEVPDSINTTGFSRHFNIYIMLDKPFQNSPHLSAGLGIGVGTSNIFFSGTYVNLKSTGSTLPFDDVSESYHFKKFKLSTGYVEVPVELRYSAKPAQPDKGFKMAFGIKGGLLLTAHTKGKNYVDGDGTSIYSKNYIQKESDRHFINSTRFAATGRIGFGHVSIDGSYQITSFLKAGAGPAIHPVSIGLTLSGL
ncbi:outer membrane beta-barrel protein [Parafilimonas sp.]|uniref:outer membrane beta-barrel protein n=1 Tax=Parafilimonas sp. TaxID=1969739 RepID=UPI0039E289D0